VLVFVRAILSWCPYTWHIYIVCNILCLNISSIYIILFCVQLLLECTCFQFLTIRQLPLKHIVITILKHSILGNNSGNNNNYIYSKSLPIEANWTKVFIYYRVLQTSIPGEKMKVDDNIYRYAKSLITTVSSQMKQEMSLKKTNGVELKKTQKITST